MESNVDGRFKLVRLIATTHVILPRYLQEIISYTPLLRLTAFLLVYLVISDDTMYKINPGTH